MRSTRCARLGAIRRIVADTNTVVSALLCRGTPHRLFEALDTAEISFYTSRELCDELTEVLGRHKLARIVKASEKSVSVLLANTKDGSGS